MADDSKGQHIRRAVDDAGTRTVPGASAQARPATGARAQASTSATQHSEPLSVCVARALECYFADLDGEPATDLFALVMDEVEAPLLQTVMARTDGNQSRAADMLGLSRGTLRKKLKNYGLL